MDNETRKKFAEVIAKAWADPSFKERLLEQPTVVLQEHDITLPAGAEARILEDTGSIKHFVLPAKPENEHTMSAADAIHTCP